MYLASSSVILLERIASSCGTLGWSYNLTSSCEFDQGDREGERGGEGEPAARRWWVRRKINHVYPRKDLLHKTTHGMPSLLNGAKGVGVVVLLDYHTPPTAVQ